MSSQLMKILNFTQIDLTYNRKGELSPQQEERTTKQRRGTKRIVQAVGLILLVIATMWTIIFWDQEELSAKIVAVSMGLLLFGLPGLITTYLGIRPMKKKIPLETIKGKAKVARVERSNSTSRYVRTEIHIAGKVFPIADEAFSEFDDGAEYALYIWKGSDHIFSLEKL